MITFEINKSKSKEMKKKSKIKSNRNNSEQLFVHLQTSYVLQIARLLHGIHFYLLVNMVLFALLVLCFFSFSLGFLRFIYFERGQCQSCASKSQQSYATESLLLAVLSSRYCARSCECGVVFFLYLEHLHSNGFELLAVYVLQIDDKVINQALYFIIAA